MASIRGGIVAMGLVGLIAGGISLGMVLAHGMLPSKWFYLVGLILGLPAFFMLVCLPTIAFSIQIEAGRVRHVLFDRFVLSDFPVSQFRRMDTMVGLFGAIIYFEQGRAIRFFGAHLGILTQLRKELQRLKREANQAIEGTAK